MSKYFDKVGKPLELLTWARLFEDVSYRRIAADTVPDGKVVSTVWLGTDYSSNNPPLIYETVVFTNGYGLSKVEEMRYATEMEAREGHRQMVQKYSAQGDRRLC